MENWVNIEGGKLQWCKIPNGPFGCTTNFDEKSQVSKTPQLDINIYNMCAKTYLPQKTTSHKKMFKKKNISQTNHLPNPEKPHIKCPKLASAPSSSAACTSSMEPGRSDWQACGGGWWVGWLETCDDLVGRLDGEIWTSQKKNGEKIWVDPTSWEWVFWTCFFLFPCVRDVSFLLEGIMAALTKLLGNYHQLDWAGKS